MKKGLILLAGTMMMAGAPAVHGGSEFDFLPEHPGKFTVTVSSQAYLKKTEADTYKRNQERLRDLLERQPVFTPPRGVEIKGYFRPNDAPPKSDKVPVPGFGFLMFHFYFREPTTGKPASICCTADEMKIFINDPGKGLVPFNATYFPSLVLYEPKRVGDMDGFPIYRLKDGSEVMILSRSSTLFWQPLTREEFLKGEIARLQKEVADSPPIDTITPRILKNHQAALAAMPPAERQMQARYFTWDPLQPMLAPANSNEGDPLVRIRPDWFDPKLPRTAFQLIILEFGFGSGIDPEKPKPPASVSIAPYRIWQALHTSNWREISKALTDE